MSYTDSFAIDKRSGSKDHFVSVLNNAVKEVALQSVNYKESSIEWFYLVLCIRKTSRKNRSIFDLLAIQDPTEHHQLLIMLRGLNADGITRWKTAYATFDCYFYFETSKFSDVESQSAAHNKSMTK